MTLIGNWFDPEGKNSTLMVRQFNALLFHELAQFVVWGARNKELVIANPDLASLLESAELTLNHGGLLEGADDVRLAD